MHLEADSPILKSTERGSVTTFAQLAACAIMFCLPWGGNVDLPGARFISFGFNLGSVGLILVWIFSVRNPLKSMPRIFSFFFFYILAHTILFYGVIHSSSLMTAGLIDVGYKVDEAISPVVFIVRVPLFVLTVYAISSVCTNVNLIKNMMLSLGASIVLILLLGGNYLVAESGTRFSGGYANPNSFASVVVLLCFLSVFVLSEQKQKKGTVVVASSLLVVAIIVVLMTASRSALLSVLGGGLVLVALGNVKKGLVYTVLIAMVVVLSTTLVSPTLFSFAFNRFTNGMGTGRAYIWLSYLQNWPQYIEYGVGLGREMTVMKELTYTGRIWPPHSTYLRVLVAFGGVGFLLFVFSLRSLLVSVVRLPRFNEGDFRSRLLLAFMVSILIQMFFGDHFDNRAIWLSLGIVGACRSLLIRND